MNKLFTETGFRWIGLTLIFLVIDQITKQITVNSMDLYQSIEVLPFFNITYVHNPGAAFSFLADQPGWQRWFFTAIASIASIVFMVWLSRTPKSNKLLSIAIALMLSGALGNLIDRVLFGYVIDFLDFYVGNSHWPAFNIADSAIFVGAAFMVIESYQSGKKEKLAEANKLES